MLQKMTSIYCVLSYAFLIFVNFAHSFKQPKSTCHPNQFHPKLPLYLKESPNDDTKKRVISPDDIYSLFANSDQMTKRPEVDPNDNDDGTIYDYDYEYDIDGEELEERNDINEIEKGTNTLETRDNKVSEVVDMKRDGLDSTSIKGKAEIESDWQILELVELEKQYHASRTSPPVPVLNEMNVEGDLTRSVDKIVIEYDWYSGLEYFELSQAINKKVKSTVIDSTSIVDKVGTVRSQDTIPRNIPQYDPTERFRGDPMQYGAYRRWKLAENVDAKKGKGNLKGKKKAKPSNADSFFNSIKNLGKGAPSAKKQGFGTRAEPPPNKPSITPQKPIAKKNKKKVITPDDIDSLFSKPEQSNDTQEEEDEEESGEVEEVEADELNEKEQISLKDRELSYASEQAVENANLGSTMMDFDPIRLAQNEEIPKWLADADKAAKQSRKIKKKAKKLTDDWRFWAAIIGSVGLISAAYNVYTQTGGFAGQIPSAQELII